MNLKTNESTESTVSMNTTTRASKPPRSLHARSLGLLAVIGLALMTPSATAQRKSKSAGSDKLTTIQGKVLRRLEVIQEGFTEITYKRGKTEHKIPTKDVLKIEWGNLPESWQRAQVAAEKGDWEKAASLYQDTANASSRTALVAAAGFLALEALLKTSAGDASKADMSATAAKSWLAAHTDHRKTPEVMGMLGKLYLLAAKPKEALKAYKDLEAAVDSKNLPTTWLARARYGQAMALTDEGEFEKARQAYSSAAATLRGQDLSKDPAAAAVFIAAEVGKGETLMAEKKFDVALNNFRGMEMTAGKNAALKTAAVCGQAAAMVEIGIASKDHKKLRTAQDRLARVSATDLLDGDSSAKALFYLGKVIRALGKDEPDSGRKAKRYFESVIQGYPDSTWALEAQRALK